MLILVSRSRQEDSRNTCPYATPRKAQHTARTAVSGARVRILGVNPRSHEHSWTWTSWTQVRGVRGSWSRCKRARDSCRMAGVLRGSRGREEEGELRDEYSLDEGIERSDAPRDAPS